MQAKNIKLPLVVLSVLAILSFSFFVIAQEKNSTQNIFLDSDQDGLSDAEEKAYGTDPQKADTDGDGYSDGSEVKSGYNPLKPAPGDKLFPEPEVQGVQTEKNSKPNEENLTMEIAKKASILSANSDELDISLDEIKNATNEILTEKLSEDELPEIPDSEIKIKKQNYSNLSEEKAKEKKKEDFISYAVSVFYIMSSNSPEPITSTNEISGLSSLITKQIISAITSRDFSSLEDLSKSGEKILEQMKALEVPEEIVETHKKGLQFIKYSISLQELVRPNSQDPIAEMINLSKVQNLVDSLMSFTQEIEDKFTEYGIAYNNDFKEKIEALGIKASDTISSDASQ